MLSKRHGGHGYDQLILRYPTPETIYPFFSIVDGMETECSSECAGTFCLYDICMTKLMAGTHFPVARPISIPITSADKNIDLKSRF